MSHVWLIFQEGLEHNVHAEITQCIFIKMHACKCPFGFLNHEAYCRDEMHSNMLPETVVVESRIFFSFALGNEVPLLVEQRQLKQIVDLII